MKNWWKNIYWKKFKIKKIDRRKHFLNEMSKKDFQLIDVLMWSIQQKIETFSLKIHSKTSFFLVFRWPQKKQKIKTKAFHKVQKEVNDRNWKMGRSCFFIFAVDDLLKMRSTRHIPQNYHFFSLTQQNSNNRNESTSKNEKNTQNLLFLSHNFWKGKKN